MIRVSCAVGLLNIQIYSGLDPADLIRGEIIDPASGDYKWQYLPWIPPVPKPLTENSQTQLEVRFLKTEEGMRGEGSLTVEAFLPIYIALGIGVTQEDAAATDEEETVQNLLV